MDTDHGVGVGRRRLYQRWDWERDIGVEELASQPGEDATYATVLLDDRELPYRVIVRNPDSPIRPTVRKANEIYVYDYFYADNGTLLEKRALDDSGSVFLIVRRRVGDDGSFTEYGWHPGAHAQEE